VRFEKPDAEARAALWSKMFPPSCRLADDVDLQRLAELYEMSGAHIKNACVRAAFLAAAAGGPIDMAAVMQAAERECREMGLLVKSPIQYEEVTPEPAPTRVPFTQPKLIPITHPRR
jgi:ATP-dependent 26S proteasome regulatory subunit